MFPLLNTTFYGYFVTTNKTKIIAFVNKNQENNKQKMLCDKLPLIKSSVFILKVFAVYLFIYLYLAEGWKLVEFILP